MQDYGVRDVERLLRLPPSTIRALVRAGFVSPTRGPRNSLRFSFQDLVVLRTAQALAKARVPQRRIVRAMVEMRRVAESGQHALDFGGEAAPAAFRMPAPDKSAGAHGWFEKALALEDEDIASAVRAYGQALAADPHHLDARINLGWLLHEVGMLKEAEKIYRTAPRPSSKDALLLYNLGVLLDDMRRPKEAIEAYKAAVASDPALADAHFNLALMYESVRRPQEAIRHMSQYRRLTGPRLR
jgi:tetratricopeptide (TPR) repeat protein